jgi:hypothetical protein
VDAARRAGLALNAELVTRHVDKRVTSLGRSAD